MKNKKIIVNIIIIILLLITIIGTTYAYLSINVIKENENNNSVDITSTDFYSVTMDLGNKIEASGVLPGFKVVKPIQVKGSNNENASDVNLSLIFTPNVSDFGSHIKYSLYKVENSTINANDICTASTKTNTNNKYRDTMSCNTSSLGQALISGIFNGIEEVEYNAIVKYNTNDTYYLIVEYLDDGDQSSEIGKTFSVTINYRNNKCEYENGKEWTFAYRTLEEAQNSGDSSQEYDFTVPCDGNYKIETWGAQGGGLYGGQGGFTSGNILLEKNKKIYIYVGSKPESTNIGGYNGGGISDSNANYHSGGGATDIRLINGEWSNYDSLNSRIMVAAAGGGSSDSFVVSGGVGGGLEGGIG